MSKITHIVVHYSATYEDQDLGVAEIRKMHKARGWKDIGYHYVIRLDGTREIGRPEWMTGAHVAGQNTGKIGICAVGGLRRATGANVGVGTRTPAQRAEMIKLIRELLAKYPGAQVVGHRDLAATQCPGFDVRSWWASVQAQVPSASAPVVTPDVREDTEHVVERGDTLYRIAVEHGMSVDDLARWNGLHLHHDVIRPGQVLTLVEPGQVLTLVEPGQVLTLVEPRPKQVNADAKPMKPRVYPPLPTPAPAPPPAPPSWWQRLLAWFRA